MKTVESNVLEMVLSDRNVASLEEEKLALEIESLHVQIQLQRLELRRIRGFVVYSAEEIKDLLNHPDQSKSLVSIETLKKHGLCGGRGGYLGLNIKLALKNWMFHTTGVKRGLDIQERMSENDSHNPALFDNLVSKAKEEEERSDRIVLSEGDNRRTPRQIRPPQSRKRQMDIGWEKFGRRTDTADAA